MGIQNMLKKDCSASRIFRALYLLDSATINRADQECFKTRGSSVQLNAVILDEQNIKKIKPTNLLSDQLK